MGCPASIPGWMLGAEEKLLLQGEPLKRPCKKPERLKRLGLITQQQRGECLGQGTMAIWSLKVIDYIADIGGEVWGRERSRQPHIGRHSVLVLQEVGQKSLLKEDRTDEQVGVTDEGRLQNMKEGKPVGMG